MKKTKEIIAKTETYGARNYKPLPVVITKGEGVWVEDPEGNRYLDMLSAYSAVNQGHCHPEIIAALKKQADQLTLTSRAFHHDQLAPFYEKVAALTGKNMILPMNTGAEAVETAIKAARRWAYDKKGVKENQAEIIVCENNFHGRTMTAVSLSSSEAYKRGFGPMLPGIKIIPYGNVKALKKAITKNTAAFLLEPIQGEAGIIIPPEGYLKDVRELCSKENVLMISDEIQTGLGRTGKLFACDWEAVIPDMYILGKALGGGVIPISAVAADSDILDVFDPGSHGSTFGGNPLACAVSCAALSVIEEEDLVNRSEELGTYFLEKLKQIKDERMIDVRGKGLFIGMELSVSARPFCERLKEHGVLCKETHEHVIRFAPPIVIRKDQLDWVLQKITQVLKEVK